MSWNQLLALLKEAREVENQCRQSKPVCCPNDGTALLADKDGYLHCPWDGWTEDMGVGEHE